MSNEVSTNFTGSSQTGSAFELKGHFNLSISGTISAGSITIQRSKDNSTWNDVDTFTSTTETYGFDPHRMFYRAVSSGDFSGDCDVVLFKEQDFHAKSVVLY